MDTTIPEWAAMRRRTIAECVVKNLAIVDRRTPASSRVEPSMSVKRNVTVPVGRLPIVGSEATEEIGRSRSGQALSRRSHRFGQVDREHGAARASTPRRSDRRDRR